MNENAEKTGAKNTESKIDENINTESTDTVKTDSAKANTKKPRKKRTKTVKINEKPKYKIIKDKKLFFGIHAQPALPDFDILSQMSRKMTEPAFVSSAVCAREIGIDHDMFILKFEGTTVNFFDSVISRKYEPYETSEIDFFSGRAINVKRYNVIIVDYTTSLMKRKEAIYSGELALLIQRKVDILAGISNDAEYSLEFDETTENAGENTKEDDEKEESK